MNKKELIEHFRKMPLKRRMKTIHALLVDAWEDYHDLALVQLIYEQPNGYEVLCEPEGISYDEEGAIKILTPEDPWAANTPKKE